MGDDIGSGSGSVCFCFLPNLHSAAQFVVYGCLTTLEDSLSLNPIRCHHPLITQVNNVIHFLGCILSNCYSLQYQSKSKITVPRSWNYKRKPCWFTLQTILQRNGPKSYNRWTRIYLQHSYFRGNVDKILAFFDHLLTTDKRTDVWSQNFIIWKINSGLWAAVWAVGCGLGWTVK